KYILCFTIATVIQKCYAVLEYLVKENQSVREWEKAQKGYMYDANNDEEIVKAREVCADLCFEFNSCRPSDTKKQNLILHKMLSSIKGEPVITAPFYCDYGTNISIGENFYTNHNCVILDGAKVTFGDNVFIAPNCVFSTAGHAINAQQRAAGSEIAESERERVGEVMQRASWYAVYGGSCRSWTSESNGNRESATMNPSLQ